MPVREISRRISLTTPLTPSSSPLGGQTPWLSHLFLHPPVRKPAALPRACHTRAHLRLMSAGSQTSLPLNTRIPQEAAGSLPPPSNHRVKAAVILPALLQARLPSGVTRLPLLPLPEGQRAAPLEREAQTVRAPRLPAAENSGSGTVRSRDESSGQRARPKHWLPLPTAGLLRSIITE